MQYILFFILYIEVIGTAFYKNSGKTSAFLNRVFLNALYIINMLESQYQIMYFQGIIFANRFQ